VLGIGGDLTRRSEGELAEARERVALSKEIRPLVQHGDLYRLRPPRGGLSARAVPARRRGRRPGLAPGTAPREPAPALRLRGLDPTATHECRETGEVHRGAVLPHHGMPVGPRGDLDVAVLRLRRI
jgi:alpha-galactosidase